MKPIFRHRVSKRTRPFFRCPPCPAFGGGSPRRPYHSPSDQHDL